MGVTLAKINESYRNANWNHNSLLQNNKPSFNAIAAKIAKKKKIRKAMKGTVTDGQTDNAITYYICTSYIGCIKISNF
jgi:hypothetical protein